VFGIENPSRNSSYPGFYLGFIFDLDVSKKSNVEYHWGGDWGSSMTLEIPTGSTGFIYSKCENPKIHDREISMNRIE
jgi:hypothetical protein